MLQGAQALGSGAFTAACGLASVTYNTACFGTKLARYTTALAAGASSTAGSLLFVTVTSTGEVLYSVTSGACSLSTELYKYVVLREPHCTLEQFEEWESTEVSFHVPVEDDADMKHLADCWQLIREKDGELLSSILAEEADNSLFGDSDDPPSWMEVSQEDYLFSYSSSTILYGSGVAEDFVLLPSPRDGEET